MLSELERLAGLLFVSPDSGVEQHKVKLAGAAQEGDAGPMAEA
ncbi:hypothetical protein HaLaN_07727 [Haematococcus lacustris]|uniref:Uncharacterized protein n=1 Tax=Haematococcus lacustris TaxID=44745 RepID=A0A699YZP5_HAELA|nr:hypothetical protein HaLaN_07727 [Haematococcus lacustris]